MKRLLLLIARFINAGLISIAFVGICVFPATAQSCELQMLNSALASPTSAERFFKAGQQQLERDIQRLQQGSGTQIAGVLKVDPAIMKQQRNWQQQQERQFLDRVHELQNPTAPVQYMQESIN